MSENNVTDKRAYSHRIETAGYRLRCIKAVPGTSGTGNKKANLTLEIFDAKPQKFRGTDGSEGGEIDINGLQIFDLFSLSPKALEGFTNPKLRSFGLPPITEADIATFDVSTLVGRDCPAVCKMETTEKKNDVTGEIIINPVSGKPVVEHRRVVDSYLPRE